MKAPMDVFGRSHLDIHERQRRFDAFEQAVEVPMLILALLMLPLLLLPELFDLSPEVKDALLVADVAIWAAFAVELVSKTYLSVDRKKYLVEHWYDVVIVVVPFLRPLRIMRSLRLLRMSRALRLLSLGTRLLQEARLMFFSYGLQYAAIIAAGVFVSLAALALAFEQDAPGSNIHNFGDAIWWGIATVTTVGYGDRFPVTTEGKVIAVFIMLLGISLFSLVTATVAAMFVKPSAQKQEATLEDVLQRLEEMEARLMAVQRSQTTILQDVREVRDEDRVRSED
jgi:voltage-gated potassium channel